MQRIGYIGLSGSHSIKGLEHTLMRTHLLIGSILAMALVAGAGCTSKVIQYKKGGEAQTVSAPETGRYSLHKSNRRTGKRFTYELVAGERVGFEEKNGNILAVAGEKEITLGKEGDVPKYSWRFKK
jgi:hypothetical protein